MPEEPLVSALMAAYNAEPFVAEALDSALAQDWPADRLEVVVVDDGSTDGTAAVVSDYVRRFPGRVKLIRQANAGPCAAVNTALAAARGEWLGLLDADDAWPHDKLRVQGAVLAAKPEVGLVYGDMRVVDAHGDVIQESWLEGEPLIPEGRCAAELLAGNPATASSLLMRAAVAEPIPAEIPYTDWWFAARAALVSDVAYVAEPRTLYRFHGGNLTLGVQGSDRVRELRKAMAFVRWFLRRMQPGAATPRGLAVAWTYFEHCERELAALGEAGVEVTAADREVARAEGHDLLGLVRAAAADPTSHAARDGLAVALASALPAVAAPLEGAGPRVALSFAEELVADPALLAAWAREMRGVRGVTLAVVTPPGATHALAQAAANLPEDVDVLAIVGAVDREAVSAIFSERARVEPPAPRFGVAGLARLAAAWS